MIQDVLRTIAQSRFKEQLVETIRELYEIERWFGFGAFERSGRYCFDKLREAGVEDVELLEFPADGRTAFWDKRMPPSWYPEEGRLEVTNPRDAFQEPVIADYTRNPFHLAMWSAATPPGGVNTEIVTENMMLAGESVEGKLVLTEPSHRPRNIYRTVCDRGGIGIVTDWVKDPFETPDGVGWMNSFRETAGWYPGAEDRDLLGFAVSPRVGCRLRELLVRRTVKAHAQVNARKVPGTILAPTGVIRGGDRPDEEV